MAAVMSSSKDTDVLEPDEDAGDTYKKIQFLSFSDVAGCCYLHRTPVVQDAAATCGA